MSQKFVTKNAGTEDMPMARANQYLTAKI